MRALIISDSHGWSTELKRVIDRHRNDVDALFHCGDSELTADDVALEGLRVVKGNCDFGDDFPEELTVKVNNVTIYVTHGHLYNVKMTHVPLSYRAEEKEAQIACFGHSHVATAFSESGVVYINPGSIRLPRQHKDGTYCICEYGDKCITITYFTASGDIVPDLAFHFNKE